MAQDNYSKVDQIFHQIALSGRATPELFFDLETSFFGKNLPDVSQGKHVFVSGLARAGTTVLMRLLHSTDEFASLTYRDMPLVMAPNLWGKLSSGKEKQGVEAERAHGDGLSVSFDSPEALEEVFWRTFSGKDYIQADGLVPMQASDEALINFRQYVSLILKRYERTRYLSKNNNSILRLPSLCRAFPEATILVPIRHPASHAASLLRQHEHFLEVHEASAFSRKYMTWLVHHEFGADHRRFKFGPESRSGSQDPTDLAYWVGLWIEAYSYLEQVLDSLSGRGVFVCYEDLVTDPDLARSKLANRLSVKIDESVLLRAAPNYPEFDTANLGEAISLFERLREKNLMRSD